MDTETEAELERLKKKYIKMGYTAYGRVVELKKKELAAALGKSTKKERDDWRAIIDLMYANLVGDDREIYLMTGKDGDKGAE